MGDIGARIAPDPRFIESIIKGLNVTITDPFDFNFRMTDKYSTVYSVFFTDNVTGRRLKTEFVVEAEDLEPFVMTEIGSYIESLTRTFIRQRVTFERAAYVKH